MNVYDEKSLLSQALIANEIIREVQLNENNDNLSVKDLVSNIRKQVVEDNMKDNIMIYSPGFLLSQFYMVFVLLGEKRHYLPKSDKHKSVKKCLNIDKKLCNNMTVNQFLRRLRNAVAHFRVQISDKYEFTFTDQNPEDKNDIFELNLTLGEMQNLYNALLCMLAQCLVKKK